MLRRAVDRLAALGLWLMLLASAAEAAPRQIEGSAVVRDDGSIAVAGEIVRLYGIWIPRTERVCSTLQRPTFCAPSAVQVLYQKVRGFLLCQEVQRLSDGSIEAYCGQRGRRLFDPRQDLGAWMVQEGWALTRPDAPPEYRALERLAESRELGLWGDKFVRVR